MAGNEHQGWAVIRLVTVQKRGEKGRLLFTTVTELAQGRPVPKGMSGVDSLDLRGRSERLHFRRTVLTKDEAISWYMSLGEGERLTPTPSRKKDREKWDGMPIQVPRLEEDQPWPKLGLPMREELFSQIGKLASDPAPFIGSVPGRLHRRFGDRAGLGAFLQESEAQAFVARRMHVNLIDYQEYLGSAVYIAPDPVVRQIDHFMVPAKDGHGERIFYRFVPRPGQSLEGVRITAFDKEARLLTSFKTHLVPSDGILEVEKGVCMGQYGFVVTHDRHGVLAYQPPATFIRQMNFSVRASSRNRRTISVPSGNSTSSPSMEYQAAMGSEVVSKSVLGEVKNPGVNVRVAAEARKRERRDEARHYGQRWFPEGSREEAALFIRDLLRSARSRVMIADPYLASLQLGQFLYVLHGSEVKATLLTTKLAFSPTPTQARLKLVEAFKFSLKRLGEHQNLSQKVCIISSSSLHDRFLVVDDEVWIVGNSLNSLGEKASMVVRLPNPDEVIERLQALAANAPDLDTYIRELSSAETGLDE